MAEHRPILRRKRTWLGIAAVSVFVMLSSCTSTRVLMQTAPGKPKTADAVPPLNIVDINHWEDTEKPRLRHLFENNIYGKMPTDLSLSVGKQATLPGTFFNDSATVETRRIAVLKGGKPTGRHFGLVIVTPTPAETPVPLILMQNFCPNHAVIPAAGIPKPDGNGFDCSMDGMMGKIFTYFFGRHIVTPPIETIMKRGYSLAVMYPSEFVPDNSETGRGVLDTVFADQDSTDRTAAIAAWGTQFSLVSDMMEADSRFSDHITLGHSRFGKAALVAAAWDDTIDAVISHQSGTGGASLSRNKPGETVTAITEGYPYWFSERFAAYAGREEDLPLDQHALLALIAPRPVLLGNSKRDVWSDPEGAFRAARAASAAYELYDSDGQTADRLTQYKPGDDQAYWIRPGTHGIVKEDWEAFLNFLDAHFK